MVRQLQREQARIDPLPWRGLRGRTVRLRFDYTQDDSRVCTDIGRPGPCGVAVDNIALAAVPVCPGPAGRTGHHPGGRAGSRVAGRAVHGDDRRRQRRAGRRERRRGDRPRCPPGRASSAPRGPAGRAIRPAKSSCAGAPRSPHGRARRSRSPWSRPRRAAHGQRGDRGHGEGELQRLRSGAGEQRERRAHRRLRCRARLIGYLTVLGERIPREDLAYTALISNTGGACSATTQGSSSWTCSRRAPAEGAFADSGAVSARSHHQHGGLGRRGQAGSGWCSRSKRSSFP